MKILFSSIHSCYDTSSGAATATRDLMEKLAARGHDCRCYCANILDFEYNTNQTEILDKLNIKYTIANLKHIKTNNRLIDFSHNLMRSTLYMNNSSIYGISPNDDETQEFISIGAMILDRFKPDILLTCGGNIASMEIMKYAKQKGVVVIFHLHNFSYKSKDAFSNATSVLVPTEYSRQYHMKQLGQMCEALDLPINHNRVISKVHNPKYLTFVNPIPAKGLGVFAGIAAELDKRRPDIPLLVVEGRSKNIWINFLNREGFQFNNVYRMKNTSNPTDFWEITKAVIVPSVCMENAALVAREAIMNGLPVIASDQGGLPETLGKSGVILPVPEHCKSNNLSIPSNYEVKQWISVIQNIWDDPLFERELQDRSLKRAKSWDTEDLLDRYEQYFSRLAVESRTHIR